MGRKLLQLQPFSDATKDLRLDPGPQEVPVDQIRLRKDADTRKLSAPHVVSLAESIAVLGLLEPLVIDTQGHLLAGAHRLAALQLVVMEDDTARQAFFGERIDRSQFEGISRSEGTKLCQRLEEQVGSLSQHRRPVCPTRVVPVLVVEVKDHAGSDDRRLAIEAAENNVRRPYTVAEIKELAARLKKAGYKGSPGRRKKGDLRPTLITALQAAVGRSRRTIERLISKQPPNTKSEWENARNSFLRVAERLLTAGKQRTGKTDRQFLAAVARITDEAAGIEPE